MRQRQATYPREKEEENLPRDEKEKKRQLLFIHLQVFVTKLVCEREQNSERVNEAGEKKKKRARGH